MTRLQEDVRIWNLAPVYREGIAAPESANNAVVASSMVPLLSLGVPGNSTSSLFLGALTIQGLRTGPTLFRDTPEMAYMIILGFLLANIIMLPLSVYYCNVLATAVLRLNRKILSGIVLVLCVTGAFAVSNNIFNVAVMVFFGFVGYSFNKYKIPQSPLILASILGSMMENNWTQSMKFADGSLSVFVTRPLSCALPDSFDYFLRGFRSGSNGRQEKHKNRCT